MLAVAGLHPPEHQAEHGEAGEQAVPPHQRLPVWPRWNEESEWFLGNMEISIIFKQFRTRLRNTGVAATAAAASMALRASATSPLTRSSKLANSGGAPLIMEQQQQDVCLFMYFLLILFLQEKEEDIVSTTKRTTRLTAAKAAAAAKAEAANKEAETAMQKLLQRQSQQDLQIYCKFIYFYLFFI